MRLEQLSELIESRLPSGTAMAGDRTGLQIQSGRREISKILVALELTDEVIEEAARLERDCIVAFHPLIYYPLKEINDADRVGRLATKAIMHSIAVISVHTLFDAYEFGISRILADKLGLRTIGFLEPDKEHDNHGMGIIASAEGPINLGELVSRVSSVCMSPVRYTTGSKELLEKIAIVGGSGGSFIDRALEIGADAFITADITYHTFHSVKGKMALIDPGHYEMEQFVPRGIAHLIHEALPPDTTLDIAVSCVLTNPVSYHPARQEYMLKQKNYLSTVQNNPV